LSATGSKPSFSTTVPSDVRATQKFVGASVILAWFIALWLAAPVIARLNVPRNWWPASKPEPPIQMGTMATSSAVRGWRNYTGKARFFPGEQVCVYAEALNVGKGGRLDLRFDFSTANPGGVEIYRQSVPMTLKTNDTMAAAYPCFVLAASAQPGKYVTKVSIYDALKKSNGQGSVQFTVAHRAGKKR
jgi:hypothetical protein